MPAEQELKEVAEGSDGYWHPFIEGLRHEGIDVLDPTRFLIEQGVTGGKSSWMPAGHPSPQTHQLLAEAATSAWDL